MTWLTALAFAQRHWKIVLGVAGYAVLGLMLILARADATHWHKQADLCAALRQADQKTYAAAVADAKAKNLTEVRATEQKWQAVADAKEKDLEAKDAAYRGAVARYVGLRNAGAPAQGGAGSDPVSQASDARVVPDPAGAETVVPVADLKKCATAVAMAEGWQDFWRDITKEQPK